MTRHHVTRTGAAIALLSIGLTGTAVVGTTVTPAAAISVRSHGRGGAVSVIVEGASVAAATEAVVAVDGTVELSLPIVEGVAAHVTPDALATLEADPALQVAPDTTLHPTAASFTAVPTDTQLTAMNPPADWSPDAGRGVAVALVDTGVADTPDLHGARLVRGPDLSGEGDGIDHYGHGTFMAGLIAGDGSASAGSAAPHFGVVPAATLVSVKVAGADGSSSVSRVIAGIGWTISHRDTYGVEVLNLSFGVDAPMPYVWNPLSAAVEAAWASGITVVASAGNEGNDHVTFPGSDPYVITVGAVDTASTASTANDTVPSWSGRQRFATAWFRGYSKPDVVAPGVSVVSLRAPGSTVDVTHPEGRVGNVYFRGTGTSMSTALVSGAAALLLSHHPAATPDDVKGALVDGATTIAGGAREVDIARADHADARPDWWQHYPVAFLGLGRGFDDGMPWTASRWSATRWAATRWSATRWAATGWTDDEWAASRWAASRWSGSRWTATRWAASRWSAEAWPSLSWR